MKPPRIALPEPTSRDSAYNQRTWPQYAQAIRNCGGVAVPIALGASQASVARLVTGCSGILLPGSPADLNPQKYGQIPEKECGPADPEREAVDEILLQDAFNLQKPILGICYGLQALNVWRNGSLRQHIAGGRHEQSELMQVHEIEVVAGSRTSEILGNSRDSGSTIWVNSSHHQSVETPGDGLSVVARSTGDGIVEALELSPPGHYVTGVQWHPERTFAAEGTSRALFQSFVEAAGAWRLEPIHDSVVAVNKVAGHEVH